MTAVRTMARLTMDAWRRARTQMGAALVLCLLLGAGAPGQAHAAANLEQVSYTTLPGNRVQLQFRFSTPVAEPSSFTIDNPARIALDFPGVASRLASRTVNVETGNVRQVTAVEAGGRTRVVIGLVRTSAFQTRVEGDSVYLVVQAAEGATANSRQGMAGLAAAPTAAAAVLAEIGDVDFRRGENGEGRMILALPNPNVAVDMQRAGDRITLTLPGVSVPNELERRLDVADFATPVRTIDSYNHGRDARIVIQAGGKFDHIAYQTDNRFIVEVKPPPVEAQTGATAKKREFTGEPLSLNFQDIEVRAVLQLIADFTGLNLVTSDTVQGNLTLRLRNVPWDQALDIILKSKGLGMREEGNVIMVAPAVEIAAREKIELESAKQIEELAPLESRSLQINYAKATDIATLLGAEANSLLSPRGRVSVDQRTNKLLIQDTPDVIDRIAALVTELDIPVRQVMIDSRIVVARDNFTKSLGVRFGVTSAQTSGGNVIGIGGTAEGTAGMIDQAIGNQAATGNPFPVSPPSLNDRLNVNLPTIAPSGQLALAVLSSDFLVDLELSAAQVEGNSKIISNPRVITANQREATIEQGVEIPYEEATSSGATSVTFKKAVLSLGVTPQITPDDRIIMDLNVSQDTVGEIYNGMPSIDTREVNTQVLVDNGETVVLGGIYEQNQINTVSRVPFFGELPIIGFLFRQTESIDDKAELLVFVTPKILKQDKSLPY